MRKPKPSKQSRQKKHPGSSAADAKAVGGSGDFGVPESNVVERTYTSRNTKRSDRGVAQPSSSEDDSRTSGAGGNDSGPGSSSGGDLDTDIIGVGTGLGVAESGATNQSPGPDDASKTSADLPSRKPAKRKNPSSSLRRVTGSTVQPPDERTIGPQGADAAPHAEGDNDSFVGEVSNDEASGRNDAGDGD